MSDFKPEFKGPIEGWVVNHLSTNYWRVQGTMSRLEVLQEAHVVFLRTCRHYEGRVENAKHFMGLFKRSWTNHFTDLTVRDTLLRQEVSDTRADGTQAQAESVGDLDNNGYLHTLIRQAPPEVSTVLSLFLSAPQELLELALGSWRAQGRIRAGGNEHVARLLGLPAGSKPLDAVEDYFSDK